MTALGRTSVKFGLFAIVTAVLTGSLLVVFGEYRTLTDAQRPKTEEQKHDQWMVRMAQATGKNLGPFFVKWGVPTSQAARDSIANLPAWMPDFPKAGVQTVAAQK